MLRLSITMVLLITIASCSRHGYRALADDERFYLQEMVNRVSGDMARMGFVIDHTQVNVVVQDGSTMKHTFNQISEASKREVKPYSALGPEEEDVKFVDGAVSRLAFYDPNTKTIVFLRGAGKALSDGYLAHELAHVYQDQRWGLDKIWQTYQEVPSRELFNITQFMVEGHAELVRHAYEQRQAKDSLTNISLSTALGKISDNDCLVCDFDQPIANLPYSFGMRFLLEQYRQGGWPLVNHFFEDLPGSTEQIMHPKKFKSDNPTKLSLPHFEAENEGVEILLDGSLGEAFLLTKLLEMQIPNDKAFLASSGWEGDIAQLYKLKSGEEALVWRILFDRTIDADQFLSAIQGKVSPGDILRHGQIVNWLISDSNDFKRRLKAFVKKNTLESEINMLDEKSTLEQEVSIKSDMLSGTVMRGSKSFIGPNL